VRILTPFVVGRLGMLTITRRLEFDAGHRVLKHESKCRHLHGHRYVAEITVSAPELDSLGRVIDFGVVKQVVGDWIDENWDHNLILHPEDPLLIVLAGMRNEEATCGPGDATAEELLGGKEPFVLDSNPTAENMARVLYEVASDLLRSHGITVEMIRLFETPNCWADYAE